jgi:hypothetical protein
VLIDFGINLLFSAYTTKKQYKGDESMGAIERNGYRFVPEFSVIQQNGAIHVYNRDKFIEEIQFEFAGKFPVFDQIEELVDEYCNQHNL